LIAKFEKLSHNLQKFVDLYFDIWYGIYIISKGIPFGVGRHPTPKAIPFGVGRHPTPNTNAHNDRRGGSMLLDECKQIDTHNVSICHQLNVKIWGYSPTILLGGSI